MIENFLSMTLNLMLSLTHCKGKGRKGIFETILISRFCHWHFNPRKSGKGLDKPFKCTTCCIIYSCTYFTGVSHSSQEYFTPLYPHWDMQDPAPKVIFCDNCSYFRRVKCIFLLISTGVLHRSQKYFIYMATALIMLCRNWIEQMGNINHPQVAVDLPRYNWRGS